MQNSLSRAKQWANLMARFAKAKDLSSCEIESRTNALTSSSDPDSLGEVIKTLLQKLRE